MLCSCCHLSRLEEPTILSLDLHDYRPPPLTLSRRKSGTLQIRNQRRYQHDISAQGNSRLHTQIAILGPSYSIPSSSSLPNTLPRRRQNIRLPLLRRHNRRLPNSIRFTPYSQLLQLPQLCLLLQARLNDLSLRQLQQFL